METERYQDQVMLASGKFFHLDSEEKARFTRAQAAETSAFIASLDLEEKVKARLHEKQFELPQVSEKVSMVLQRRSVRKDERLWVCGVIRMDDVAQGKGEADDAAAAAEFDAWPSEEGRKKTQHALSLAEKYEVLCNSGMGMQLEDRWWEYDSDICISDVRSDYSSSNDNGGDLE